MHAMMTPDQILEHAQAAEAAGAHRFCMVTQGQGLSKRDFQRILEGARLVAEHTNLKRCASIGHMSVERARQLKDAGIQRVHHNVETAESYYPEVSTTVRYEGRLRTIDAVEEAGLETCVGGILNLGESREQRVEMAFQLAQHQPDQRADQHAQPAPGHQVRRPRLHGSLGGGQVDRDLPADPAGGAVPALRRARREPRRAALAGRQGRHQRRDDGQLPHDARLRARGRPGDVRGAGAQRGAPARQRHQPAPGQPLRAGSTARRRGRRSTSWSTRRTRRTSGTRRPSCATAARPRCRPVPTGAENTFPEVVQVDPEAAEHERDRGAARRHSRSAGSTASCAACPGRRGRACCWTGGPCCCCARTTTSGWPITRACARRPPRRRCATAPARAPRG